MQDDSDRDRQRRHGRNEQDDLGRSHQSLRIPDFLGSLGSLNRDAERRQLQSLLGPHDNRSIDRISRQALATRKGVACSQTRSKWLTNRGLECLHDQHAEVAGELGMRAYRPVSLLMERCSPPVPLDLTCLCSPLLRNRRCACRRKDYEHAYETPGHHMHIVSPDRADVNWGSRPAEGVDPTALADHLQRAMLSGAATSWAPSGHDVRRPQAAPKQQARLGRSPRPATCCRRTLSGHPIPSAATSGQAHQSRHPTSGWRTGCLSFASSSWSRFPSQVSPTSLVSQLRGVASSAAETSWADLS